MAGEINERAPSINHDDNSCERVTKRMNLNAVKLYRLTQNIRVVKLLRPESMFKKRKENSLDGPL